MGLQLRAAQALLRAAELETRRVPSSLELQQQRGYDAQHRNHQRKRASVPSCAHTYSALKKSQMPFGA
jgi:hypothetical protein